MKILQIYRFSPRARIGGVLSMIKTLSSGLAQQGVDVTVLGVSDKVDHRTVTHQENYRIIDFRESFSVLGTPFSVEAVKEIHKFSESFDGVHFHVPCPVSLLMSPLIKQKPKIVTYHADVVRMPYVYGVYKQFERNFMRDMEAIVPTSPNYLNSSRVLQKYKEKSKVITIGVKDISAEELGGDLPSGNMPAQLFDDYILFLGVIRPYKNAAILIEAARRLPHINFVMAGPGTKEFLKYSNAINLQNVKGIGEVSEREKRDLLKASSAVILPSSDRGEALGLSLIEGSMFGKPLLSFEISTGTSFVNVDGETGFVISKTCSEEMCARIEELYSQKALREMMGNNARARYLELFTPEKMVNAYLELYSSLV